MRFNVVIPARFASQRLPGKPLADLNGKPLILHACDCAKRSGAARVIVATDDARIQQACQQAGVEAQMTAVSHASGTDRIAEVAERLDLDDGELVVNLQGDEPMMPASDITQVAGLLVTGSDMSTLCTPIHDHGEFVNPNVVKVVADGQGRALYFSRAPIPWNRDDTVANPHEALRHIGIYGYRVGALKRLSVTPPCELEQIEKLEQLRALWLGMSIAVGVAREVPGPSVDTPEDLKRVAALLRSR
ncbi:MAG TPA: 3-deoxy-manno-octulosonate cytidylyltransferase [Gammaproteobacteria bacterium]|jgi:3-deoxy-manno-octulosonate cytidylyltransferase (CMP-KDO synthetase)